MKISMKKKENNIDSLINRCRFNFLKKEILNFDSKKHYSFERNILAKEWNLKNS